MGVSNPIYRPFLFVINLVIQFDSDNSIWYDKYEPGCMNLEIKKSKEVQKEFHYLCSKQV